MILGLIWSPFLFDDVVLMPIRHFRNLRNKVKPWKEAAARRMAANQTPPEKALWEKLKDKQLGVCFHKQQVILYIVDFSEASCILS